MSKLAAVSVLMTAVLLLTAPSTSAEEPPAVDAAALRLDFPLGLAFAPDGTLYVSERRGHRVWRWHPETGRVTVAAGTGESGFSGDGGPAPAARLSCPDSIDVDGAGHLYVADRCNERIRRVHVETGVIVTVAGNAERGPSPDGPALDVALTGPYYVNARPAGSLLFTDTDAHLIRRLDLDSGRISTLAGSGDGGFAGDGGPALEARLRRPHVAVRLRNGDLVVGDSFNQRIRIVSHETGTIRTVAGKGELGAADDGTPALEAPFAYFGDMVEEEDGILLFTEWVNGRVVRLDLGEGRLRIVAGTTDPEAPDRDGLDPLATRLGRLAGLELDGGGRIYVVDAEGGRVRRIDPERRTVETVVGPPPR